MLKEKNNVIFYDIFHKKSSAVDKIIPSNNFTYFHILKIINRIPLGDKKILDIGCGDGTLSLYLAANGAQVFGYDVSKLAIKIAKQTAKRLRLNSARFFYKDLENIKSIEGSFDIIICSEILEHLKNDDLLLKLSKKALAKNGLIIVSVPSLKAPIYRLGFAKKFDFRVGHLRRYSVSSIKKAIEGVGFKIIKTYRTESILRNSLFLFKPLGFFIKFIRGFLVKIFHVFDQLLVLIFGESQIFIVAKK